MSPLPLFNVCSASRFTRRDYARLLRAEHYRRFPSRTARGQPAADVAPREASSNFPTASLRLFLGISCQVSADDMPPLSCQVCNIPASFMPIRLASFRKYTYFLIRGDYGLAPITLGLVSLFAASPRAMIREKLRFRQFSMRGLAARI